MSGERTRRGVIGTAGAMTAVAVAGCLGSDDATNDDGMDDAMAGMESTDPESAPRATVDRFSEAAGTNHVRGPDTDLPDPGQPVDFDEQFLVEGFGPDGEAIQYYDFDAQPPETVPIYTFVTESGEPVEDQLNVVGVIPGDDDYNDFWQVTEVTVPDSYEPNTITSERELMEAGLETTRTNTIRNCPIVPDGSTASLRGGDSPTDLVEGWYDGEVVSYFRFEEAPLESAHEAVPLSPIYVAFNTNPGADGGGPASGFMTEVDSEQTHNVTATLPSDESYSPLWQVTPYDNAEFESVSDLDSATAARSLESGGMSVNCPIVAVTSQ